MEDKHAANSNGTQECPDFRDVLTRAPFGDLVDIFGVRKSALGGTTVSDCYDFFGAERGLVSAEGASAIFDALHYPIEVLEMFPNKSAYARIVWYAFFGAVRKEILLRGTSDRNVVDIWNNGVGDFGLEYAGDIVMEYRN